MARLTPLLELRRPDLGTDTSVATSQCEAQRARGDSRAVVTGLERQELRVRSQFCFRGPDRDSG